ncbi:MAG: hypothetical protein EA351_02325 [Gemmatimonadales bacterium]|nr:MAG: hypothetical protein EA351_02325 [Gemmatimonadales bacterium]
MTLRFLRCTLAVPLTLAITACGSDNSPSAPGDSGSISATINGQAWSASAPFAQAQHNQAQSLVTLWAADPNATYGMSISLSEFTGPGTYEIRPGFPLRMAVVTLGSDPGWGTQYSGTPGTITIAQLTSSRATGTFQFTAEPSPSSSQTGTLMVTQGQFDVPVIVVGQGAISP